MILKILIISKGCKYRQLVGDGYCNDEANKIQCGFDGGDCCYSNIRETYCSECKCLTGNDGEVINYSFVGDGYCHDEFNNAEYNYDGGDCCGSCVVKTYCLNCTCFTETSEYQITDGVYEHQKKPGKLVPS